MSTGTEIPKVVRMHFQEDGWAIFSSRKFKYEFGLDHVLNRYEYFVDRETNDLFASKQNQGRLSIFKS